MSEQFKPGDVVVATHPLRNGLVNGIIDTDGRFYTTDQTCKGISSSAFAPENLRPLVVIDPEDREQVERLTKSIVEAAFNHGNLPVAHNGIHGDTIEAALRSLIAPPKPEEPTGLGAVVVDEDGDAWVHDRDKKPGYLGVEWLNVRTQAHRRYESIAAVRVLSEGVAR